jgi:hypothetical protein
MRARSVMVLSTTHARAAPARVRCSLTNSDAGWLEAHGESAAALRADHHNPARGSEASRRSQPLRNRDSIGGVVAAGPSPWSGETIRARIATELLEYQSSALAAQCVSQPRNASRERPSKRQNRHEIEVVPAWSRSRLGVSAARRVSSDMTGHCQRSLTVAARSVLGTTTVRHPRL